MSKVVWGILGTANIGIKRVIPAILSGERGVIAASGRRHLEREQKQELEKNQELEKKQQKQ
jgi:predicted dehydrogenase